MNIFSPVIFLNLAKYNLCIDKNKNVHVLKNMNKYITTRGQYSRL